MTVEWNRTVTEVVWESQTAPGITWTTVVGGTSSGGGVTVHNDLSGRSAADAHPMSAITDLEPALTDIATAVQAQQGDIGTLQTAVAGKQAADADLTAIAALAPADDALIQRKAGAWTSRTPAQVKADMSIGVGDVSGLDENTRDVIGTALVAGSGVAVTVDDPGNTITIAVSGVVADAINDGTTTVAPSQNAVFDALALKVANPGGSNDDFLQRKAGAWAARTIAQVKTDLGVGRQLAHLGGRGRGVPTEIATYHIASTYALTANRLYLHPIVVSNPVTITAANCEVTATGAGTVVMGIYNAAVTSSRWLPTSLVSSFGTVSVSSTGVKTISSLSVTLPAGVYMMALCSDVAPTVRVLVGTPIGGAMVVNSGTTNVFDQVLGEYLSLTYASPLPSTAPAGTPTYHTAASTAQWFQTPFWMDWTV